MKPTARKHHYLPQAYLGAFTDSGTKEGQFYVFGTGNGNCFRTSPKNVAAQRDFNRVDIEGKSPDVLEQALSPLEGLMVEACRIVCKTKTFPNEKDFNYIINLLALIAVRNPKLRTSFNRAREQSMKIMSSMLVSDKKIFEHHMKKAIADGYVDENNVTFEEMKRFVEDEEYEIEFLPEGNLRIELNSLDTLIPLLGQRTWSVFLTPDNGPNFICSDHPVALTWKNSASTQPVGFGLQNTEVFFPIGPSTALYGVYETPARPVVTLNSAQVAKMNTRIAENAERYIFSTEDKFYVWHDREIKEVDCRHNQKDAPDQSPVR